MGSGGSKKKDEKNPSPINSALKTTTVNYTNKQSDSRIQQQKQPSQQHQQEHSDNNNVQKPNTDLRNRHVDKSDNENLDDLDLDSGWYGNKNSTKVRSTGRQTKDMNEYNRQQSVDAKRQSPVEEYPETYAQRNLRALYRKENLLRQKTIYRDPDDWDDVKQQEDSTAFDVSKFKQANKPTQIKRDIFGDLPDYTQRNQYMDGDPDSYYHRNESTHHRVEPKYDISEEELMADIDKEFN